MSYFSHAWILWLLAVIPILAIITRLGRRRKRRDLALLGHPSAVAELMPEIPRFGRAGILLTGAGLALVIIAAAGPRWGSDPFPETVAGRDLVVLLDLSRSMNATDAPPSRLERARLSLFELAGALKRRGGHRVALVVFGPDAQVIVPLTHDYDHFRSKLMVLDIERPPPGLRPRPGTASGTRLGAGLLAAVAAHDPSAGEYRDVLVISDGDDPVDDGEWEAGLRMVRTAGIPFHMVGIGDPEQDSPVTVPGRPAATTRLHERPLREIARQTGGDYLPTHRTAPRLVEWFDARIATKPARIDAANPTPIVRSREIWFYLLSMILIALGWMVGGD
jgi:Ca-activated chloride channel family protein